MEFISKNEKETLEFSKKMAQSAKGGDIFALYGNLGSGKTTFVRGLAIALGVVRNITSPTFVIMKEYQLPENINGINKIYHLDCYRFKDESDADSIGLRDILNRDDAIVLVEWPEVIESILPVKTTKKIYFSYINENSREISYEK